MEPIVDIQPQVNFSQSFLLSPRTPKMRSIAFQACHARFMSTNTKLAPSSKLSRILSQRKDIYNDEHERAVQKLKGRSLLRIDDYDRKELQGILAFARDIKRLYKEMDTLSPDERQRIEFSPMAKKTIGMIFQKRSTRTRVSTETGMYLLGGHSLFLSSEDIQLGKGESIRDSATVLSRFNSLILARVFGHEVIEEFAKYSTVPVINALSSMHHPLQILADFMTLQEQFGVELQSDQGGPLTLGWVGDGNNVSHDIILGAPLLGMNVQFSAPLGYEAAKDVVKKGLINADKFAEGVPNKPKPKILLMKGPNDAIRGADVIITDTWVSMGQERDALKRKEAFKGYQVTLDLANQARPNWKFMHCLPRHKEEVSDDVFYSKQRSIVWDEAENRMWTVMAVMCSMLGITRIPLKV